MANKEDIARIVLQISAAFPNWKVTEFTVDVYYTDLKDIPLEELHAAAQLCRTEAGRAFAPSTGELRGAVMDLRRAMLNIPSPYEAWQEVLEGFKSLGYDMPEFSSPLITKVVRSLGWRNLCMSENQTADRARFLQAYEQLTNRVEKEMMMTPEIKAYIQDNGGLLIESGEQIKMITGRLEK